MGEDNGKVPALGPSASDRVAAVSRAAVSLVPWAGGALAEVVNEFIPNQRLERIEKFLSYLHEEINSKNIDENKLKTSAGADFVVQGGENATRASTDEKIRYLARCVAEGISAEAVAQADERRLITMISELDERDFLILRSYVIRSQDDASIRPDRPNMGAPREARVTYELYEAAVERLERYGLLYFKISTDFNTRMPKFDRFSGKPEGYRLITDLGERVLDRVGLMPSTEEREKDRPRAFVVKTTSE